MVITKMAMDGIIDKQELCVKYYYYTIFGVPKMLTHSGIGYIQTLNLIATISNIISFQLDHTEKCAIEEKWEVFFPESIRPHRYRAANGFRDLLQKPLSMACSGKGRVGNL
jgi:hypothetical protein